MSLNIIYTDSLSSPFVSKAVSVPTKTPDSLTEVYCSENATLVINNIAIPDTFVMVTQDKQVAIRVMSPPSIDQAVIASFTMDGVKYITVVSTYADPSVVLGDLSVYSTLAHTKPPVDTIYTPKAMTDAETVDNINMVYHVTYRSTVAKTNYDINASPLYTVFDSNIDLTLVYQSVVLKNAAFMPDLILPHEYSTYIQQNFEYINSTVGYVYTSTNNNLPVTGTPVVIPDTKFITGLDTTQSDYTIVNFVDVKRTPNQEDEVIFLADPVFDSQHPEKYSYILDNNNDFVLDCTGVIETDSGLILASDDGSVLLIKTDRVPCDLRNLPFPDCGTHGYAAYAVQTHYSDIVIAHLKSEYLPTLVPDYHNKLVYVFDTEYQRTTGVVDLQDKPWRCEYLKTSQKITKYAVASGLSTGLFILGPDYTATPKRIYNHAETDSYDLYCVSVLDQLSIDYGCFDFVQVPVSDTEGFIYACSFFAGIIHKISYVFTSGTSQPPGLSLQASLDLDDHLHGMVYVQDNNELWVTGYRTGVIHVIDLSGFTELPYISTGLLVMPCGIAYLHTDSAVITNLIAVSHPIHGRISVYSVQTKQQVFDFIIDETNKTVPVDLLYNSYNNSLMISDYANTRFYQVNKLTASTNVADVLIHPFVPDRTPIAVTGFARQIYQSSLDVYTLYGAMNTIEYHVLFDPSDFRDVYDAATETFYESNSIKILYAPIPSSLSLEPDITDAVIILNGSIIEETHCALVTGDVVSIIAKSSAYNNQTVDVAVTINEYVLLYSIRTLDFSKLYNGFVFDDIYDATPGQVYTSNTVTILYDSLALYEQASYQEELFVDFVDAPSESAGLYVNDQLISTNRCFVKQNDRVYITIKASALYNREVYAEANLTGYKSAFIVKTRQAVVGVCMQEPLVFIDIDQQPLLSEITSNSVMYTPARNTTAYITNTFRSKLFVDDQETDYVNMLAGSSYKLYIKIKTLALYGVDHSLTLSLNSECDYNPSSKLTWVVRTIEQDATIDPIDFIDIMDADLPDVTYTSNTEHITGITSGTVLPVFLNHGVLVVNGNVVTPEYIDNSPVPVRAGTVTLNDAVAIRIVTKFPMMKKTTVTITIGVDINNDRTYTTTWSVTTRMLTPYIDRIATIVGKNPAPEAAMYITDKLFAVIKTSHQINISLPGFYNSYSLHTVTAHEYDSVSCKIISKQVPVDTGKLFEVVKSLYPVQRQAVTSNLSLGHQYALPYRHIYKNHVYSMLPWASSTPIASCSLKITVPDAVLLPVSLTTDSLHTSSLDHIGSVAIKSDSINQVQVLSDDPVSRKTVVIYSLDLDNIPVYQKSNRLYNLPSLNKEPKYRFSFRSYNLDRTDMAVGIKSSTLESVPRDDKAAGKLRVRQYLCPYNMTEFGVPILTSVLCVAIYDVQPALVAGRKQVMEKISTLPSLAKSSTMFTQDLDVLNSAVAPSTSKVLRTDKAVLDVVSNLVLSLQKVDYAINTITSTSVKNALSAYTNQALDYTCNSLLLSMFDIQPSRLENVRRLVDVLDILTGSAMHADLAHRFSLKYPHVANSKADVMFTEWRLFVDMNLKTAHRNSVDNKLAASIDDMVSYISTITPFQVTNVMGKAPIDWSFVTSIPAEHVYLSTVWRLFDEYDSARARSGQDFHSNQATSLYKSESHRGADVLPAGLFERSDKFVDMFTALYHVMYYMPVSEQYPADIHVKSNNLTSMTECYSRPDNKRVVTLLFHMLDISRSWFMAEQADPRYLNLYKLAYTAMGDPLSNKDNLYLVDACYASVASAVRYLHTSDPVAGKHLLRYILLGKLVTIKSSALNIGDVSIPLNRQRSGLYTDMLNGAMAVKSSALHRAGNIYRFKKIGGSYNEDQIKYSCMEAKYFPDADAAMSDALSYGYSEEDIIVVKMGALCYVWGTVPDPSTACPNDDALRGYVHGG